MRDSSGLNCIIGGNGAFPRSISRRSHHTELRPPPDSTLVREHLEYQNPSTQVLQFLEHTTFNPQGKQSFPGPSPPGEQKICHKVTVVFSPREALQAALSSWVRRLIAIPWHVRRTGRIPRTRKGQTTQALVSFGGLHRGDWEHRRRPELDGREKASDYRIPGSPWQSNCAANHRKREP